MAAFISHIHKLHCCLLRHFRTSNVQFMQIARASRSQLGKPGEYRMDKDTLGETRVPADKYYGSETARSINNFPSGGENERMPFPLISAIGIIKKAAAIANKDFGLDSQIADAIVKASEEVMCGELYCQHFPLGIWQAGAATNSHINANEVIANRAIEIMGGEIGSKCPVHPNDHVNMGQSTNDVIPSAIHIALALELHNNTLPGIKCLAEELEKKSKEWYKITKVGRTHLMDAVPIKLGQEFCGYYCQICDGLERIEATLPGLYELQMGGTAVGTELNAACGFGEKVASLISQYTGLPFVISPKKIAGCACLDSVVHLSAALSTLSCSLMKVVNDIRHMASGPSCGINELILPEKEPGSSIMPGKVNPTQCEAVLNIAALTIGNHVGTTIGGSLGNWELNLYKPLIFVNTLRSSRLIGHVCKAFTKNCLKDTRPNEERIREMLEKNLMVVTALNPHIGYDKAAKIAVMAHKENFTLKEAATKEGISEADFDRWVIPEEMTRCTDYTKRKRAICGKKEEKKKKKSVCDGKEKNKMKSVCDGKEKKKMKSVCDGKEKEKKKSVCNGKEKKPKKSVCIRTEKKRRSICERGEKNKKKDSVCDKKDKETKSFCDTKEKKKEKRSKCDVKHEPKTKVVCTKQKVEEICPKIPEITVQKKPSICGKQQKKKYKLENACEKSKSKQEKKRKCYPKSQNKPSNKTEDKCKNKKGNL